MKKIVICISSILILTIVTLLIVIQRPTSNPISISDGAYNSTAKEFVALMNNYAKCETGYDILTWPKYEKSDTLVNIGKSLNYALCVNNEGFLTSIYLEWYPSMTAQEQTTLLFYRGLIIRLLSPENEDYVNKQLQFNSTHAFTVYTVTDNGTNYKFGVGGANGNYFIATPAT